MIDLHSHTNASDGELSPEGLFSLAHQKGVTTLAVTDHDTVDGLAACDAAARARGMTLVPGIEITAYVNRREVHVLGHFVDRAESRLKSFGELLRTERRRRMEQMVDRMKQLGFPVTMDEVLAIAGDAHLARPHLARLLVEKRFVLTTKEAFDKFLADGKPAHVPRYEISGEEAIALIRGARGAATVAHPGVNKLERFELQALKDKGLAGIEALHSDHAQPLREKYLALAKELDLVPTAGSDFHGPTVAPGRELGTASMDAGDFARLKARAG